MDRRLTESIWCTGKDSNLRTSLGGTDLQSVGFNHSPTCANFPGRCGRRAPSNRKLRRLPARVHGNLQINSPLTFATQGNHGSRLSHREDHYTPEKRSEWSAFGKTRCAAAAAYSNRFLELAKGFEPPTP